MFPTRWDEEENELSLNAELARGNTTIQTMFFFLPKSLYRLKIENLRVFRSHSFWHKRKVFHDEYSGTTKIVIFWVFLLFAVRVGSVIWMSFEGLKGFEGLYVNLPTSQSGSFITPYKQGIQIWVTKDYLISVNDKIVPIQSIQNEIESLINNNPDIETTYFFIDQTCIMKAINEIITKLKISGISRFIFITWDYIENYPILDIEFPHIKEKSLNPPLYRTA